MNKALRYFGGKKEYFIPFIVLISIFTLNCLLKFYYLNGLLFNALFLLSVVSLWLGFKRKAFIVITSFLVLSSLLNIVLQVHNMIEYEINAYEIISVIIGALYHISCVLAIILLWLKANNKTKIKPYMMILFIPMSGIMTFIMGIIESNNSEYMYFDMSYNLIFSLLPQLCLVGAFVLLWLPLEKFSVCPKCGHRNTKNSAFCGLCGSEIKDWLMET